MYFGYFTLFSALAISAIAAWYSIIGLTAIFAAALVPIIVMGVALETGKVVTAVWLHQNWQRAKVWMRTYLAFATIVLMFITSMGIFGFLSKAHIEQTAASTEAVAQIERVESEIARNRAVIENADNRIKRLETSGVGADANIQAQIDKEQQRIDSAYKRVEPAIAEQQRIIDGEAKLYDGELARIDEQLATLQKYIDTGETKKAQQMIGASADGIFGKRTADKIGEWQDEKQKERNRVLAKIESATNGPKAKAARDEIARLRKSVENQVAQSNTLITRLRAQLGQTQSTDIDTQVDEQRNRIKTANTEIETLTTKKFELEATTRKLEAEVGPVKYIAEFIYGAAADRNMLEEAVRWVIIVLVLVFDPLAICLILAGTQQIVWGRQDRKRQQEEQYIKPNLEKDSHYWFEDVDQETLDKEMEEEKNIEAERIIEQAKRSDLYINEEEKAKVDDPDNQEIDYHENEPIVIQPGNEAEVPKDLEPQVKEPPENFPVSEADLTESNDLPEEQEIKETYVKEVNKFVYPDEIVHTPVKDPVTNIELDPADREWEYSSDGRRIYKPEAGFPIITTHPSDPLERGADDSTHPDTEGEPEVEPVTAPLSEKQQEIVQKVEAVTINKPAGKVLSTVPLFHAEPDNKSVINSGFGSVFPETNLTKGDLFLRTDYLPSKLFRWNADKWIEVDKQLSTSYTYDEKYVEYLIEKLKTGEYDLEDLSHQEQDQVQEYLQKNVQ